MSDFIPRPAQAKILQYQHGKMGIAAVPGSGKTHTLSYLAASLIASDAIQDGQEVLVVTLVNSAVQNFSKRISRFVKQFGLLENIGYRVRTLHGLAHDIVRERPDLAGLDNQFQIVDEHTSSAMLDQIVTTWMRNHTEFMTAYTHPESQDTMQYVQVKWKAALLSMAGSFIHQAKDMELTPDMLRDLADETQNEQDLLHFGIDIYRDYQNALSYQAAIDFEDLIRLAYRALQMDAGYLQRLRERWPYILEDEAQDSSSLQEKILGLLCGDEGNWVRVGDPNQAIYETFTTADPKYLLEFLRRGDVQAFDLPNSGRSTRSIMALANHLIEWNDTQPSPALVHSLVPPLIQPTPPDDPQPNPADQPEMIFLFTEKLTPEKEEDMVVQSVTRWIRENPQQTAAILVTRNDKGASLVQKLKNRKVSTVELLQTSFSTRSTAKKLADLLDFFADPTSSKKLSSAFESLYKDRFEEADQKKALHAFCLDIKKQSKVEELLFKDTDESGEQCTSDPVLNELFQHFTRFLQVNQRASLLPIQQCILTLSSQLFSDAHELALAYKLAEVMERAAKTNPTFGLKDFAAELDKVYRNRLRINGFSEEELEFDPDQHKGEVVVATIHKAKGLEWDRVYIVSANNYDFPSNQPYDQYISEKYFIRDQLNLEAEMLAHLKALASHSAVAEGDATNQARNSYSAERIRLFYVGITRARRELVITWNEGKFNNCVMAVPFMELSAFWEDEHARLA